MIRRSALPPRDWSLPAVVDRLPGRFWEIDPVRLPDYLDDLRGWLADDQMLNAGTPLNPDEFDVIHAIGDLESVLRAWCSTPCPTCPDPQKEP